MVLSFTMEFTKITSIPHLKLEKVSLLLECF